MGIAISRCNICGFSRFTHFLGETVDKRIHHLILCGDCPFRNSRIEVKYKFS